MAYKLDQIYILFFAASSAPLRDEFLLRLYLRFKKHDKIMELSYDITKH